MKRSYFSKILLALLVTLIFLFLLYRLQKISLRELLSLFAGASTRLLFLGFVVMLTANLVRSLRFHFLLGRHGYLKTLFASNNVYNLATATFPGGLGEIFSVFIFQRYNGINTGTAFSLIVLSRLFDLLSLCLIIMVALKYCSCSLAKLLALASLGFGTLSLLLLIPPINRTLVGLLNRFLPPYSFLNKIKDFLSQVEGALSYVHNAREWFFLLLLSFVMTSLNILSLLVLLQAIGINISFAACSISFGIYAILQLLPVHGIGGVGTQEAWWTLGLTSVGVPKEVAIPVSFFLHGMFYLYILVIAVFLGFPLLKKTETKEATADGILFPK